MKQSFIGVVMTTWNKLEVSQAALASIRSAHQMRIVVVDDNSTDGTREWLTQNEIRWIDGSVKPGLAAKWNMGVDRMWDEGASHVAIFNNDILCSPLTVDGMVAAFKPGVFVVCAANLKGVLADPREILEYRIQRDEESSSGGFSAFTITPECWQRVGRFDEGFVQFDFEDMDYLHRVHLAGGRAISSFLAPYYHYEGVSKSQDSNFVKRSHEVNKAYFRKKWGWLIGIEPKPDHVK
jgi:GT2 family glycosyltransferase